MADDTVPTRDAYELHAAAVRDAVAHLHRVLYAAWSDGYAVSARVTPLRQYSGVFGRDDPYPAVQAEVHRLW